MLQDVNLVVVDINVLEKVFRHNIQNITSLEEVVNSRRALTLDDILFVMRTATVNLLRHRLADA